jgi:ribonuclease T1
MGVRALLVAVAVLLSSSLSSSCEVPGPALSASERRARRTLDLSQVPDGEHTALVEVVATIDAGGPFAYRQDGTIFQNRERRLPLHPVGFWHEYTVPTPGSRDRGARRVVGGDDDSLFYTRNHYGSFVQIRDAANDNVEDAAAADPVGTTR